MEPMEREEYDWDMEKCTTVCWNDQILLLGNYAVDKISEYS